MEMDTSSRSDFQTKSITFIYIVTIKLSNTVKYDITAFSTKTYCKYGFFMFYIYIQSIQKCIISICTQKIEVHE